MNNRTKNRIKGFLMIVLTSSLVVFLIWQFWPQPKSDLVFTRVDLAKVIIEGDSLEIGIELKNSTGKLFNRKINITLIPDTTRGSVIPIYDNIIQIDPYTTERIRHKLVVRSKNISSSNYKKSITSEFALSGDQVDENNTYTTKTTFYKKSQTVPLKDRFKDYLIPFSSSFTIQYTVNGDKVSKKFDSKEDLMKANIPKDAKITRLSNAQNINLMNKELLQAPAVIPN